MDLMHVVWFLTSKPAEYPELSASCPPRRPPHCCVLHSENEHLSLSALTPFKPLPFVLSQMFCLLRKGLSGPRVYTLALLFHSLGPATWLWCPFFLFPKHVIRTGAQHPREAGGREKQKTLRPAEFPGTGGLTWPLASPLSLPASPEPSFCLPSSCVRLCPS